MFDTVETGSLRAVYLLAVSALGHTHHVDEQVMKHLAEAVFTAYVDSKFPRIPLLSTQVEDLAVLSIELMQQDNPESFYIKQ